jgi:hypothetical protein
LQEQATFPFLRLPRELRDEVYRLALCVPPGVSKLMYDNVSTLAFQLSRSHQQDKCLRRCRVDSQNLQSELGILVASHTLFQEVIETLYHDSTFFVTMDDKLSMFGNRYLPMTKIDFAGNI